MTSYELNGKVALVTGAARGIGLETARQIHARGGSVALVDLDAGEAREAAAGIGERAIGIGADVTDAGAIGAAVAEAVERFGGLDVAVANAGIAPASISTARTVPVEEWERVVEVNLLGAWRTARAALPQVSARGGQLVFLGSVYSFSNGMLGSSYAVSKAGVESLGRSLRAELAPFGASATVAYFGWVQTELVRGALDRRGGARMLEQILPRLMLRRISPETAATVLVDGLERRAARVYAPPVWRYVSALRGLIGPLSDRHLGRDESVRATVRQAEAEAEAERPVS